MSTSGGTPPGRSAPSVRVGLVLLGVLALVLGGSLVLPAQGAHALAAAPSNMAGMGAASANPIPSHHGATTAASASESPLLKRSAIDPVLPYLNPRPHLPAPGGPGLPNLTGNITGFTLAPLSFSLTGNTGQRFNATIGAMPTGANSSTYVFVLLGETVSTNSTALVGYIEGTLGPITAALPLYLVLNGTTLSTCGFGGQIMMPGPTVHTFAMEQAHQDWWNFLLDGSPIAGGSGLGGGGFCSGTGNGTANLYAASTSPFVLPLFAWLVSANVSGLPTFQIPIVSEYRTGSTWSQSTAGTVILDSVLGVEGYLQDSTIPPDSVVGGPTVPVQTPATFLWNTGPLPALTLDQKGLPGELTSGESAPFTVWINSSSTHKGVSGANLATNSSLGGAFVPNGGGSVAGEDQLVFTAPDTIQHGNDTITLLATGTGYVGVRSTYALGINAALLVLHARPPASPVPSGSTTSIPFWVNTSLGVPAVPTQLVPSVKGGGTVVLDPAGGTTPGLYFVDFTAPLFSRPSNSTVVLTASGPGLITQSGWATVPVGLRPLLVLGPPPGNVWVGSTVSFGLSLSTPIGNLPVAGGSLWNATVLGDDGGVPIPFGDTVAAAGATAVLRVSMDPTYLGPVWFWMNVSAPGFVRSGATWWENSTGNVTLQLSGLSAEVTEGQSVALTLEVLGLQGYPLDGAVVEWSASSGGFGPNDEASALGYTDSTGRTTVQFDPGSVSNDTPLLVSASVTYPYYAPASVTGTSTDTVATGLLATADHGVALIDLILALLLLSLLLALYAESRSRQSRRSPGAGGVRGAGSGTWAPRDAGEGEGRAPWPGAITARYEEEELGASDRPPERDAAPSQMPPTARGQLPPPTSGPSRPAEKEGMDDADDDPLPTETSEARNSPPSTSPVPPADDSPTPPQAEASVASATSGSAARAEDDPPRTDPAPPGAPAPTLRPNLADPPSGGEVEPSSPSSPPRGTPGKDARAGSQRDQRNPSPRRQTRKRSGTDLVE